MQKTNVSTFKTDVNSHADTSTGRTDMRCPNCGNPGHQRKDCPDPKAVCTVKDCRHADNHCSRMHDVLAKYYSDKWKSNSEKLESSLMKEVRKTNLVDYNESMTYFTTVCDVLCDDDVKICRSH